MLDRTGLPWKIVTGVVAGVMEKGVDRNRDDGDRRFRTDTAVPHLVRASGSAGVCVCQPRLLHLTLVHFIVYKFNLKKKKSHKR